MDYLPSCIFSNAHKAQLYGPTRIGHLLCEHTPPSLSSLLPTFLDKHTIFSCFAALRLLKGENETCNYCGMHLIFNLNMSKSFLPKVKGPYSHLISLPARHTPNWEVEKPKALEQAQNGSDSCSQSPGHGLPRQCWSSVLSSRRGTATLCQDT